MTVLTNSIILQRDLRTFLNFSHKAVIQLKRCFLVFFVNHLAALVKLKPKLGKCAVESESVKTVCLPSPQQSLQPGITCEIAGYGKESHGEENALSNVVTSD